MPAHFFTNLLFWVFLAVSWTAFTASPQVGDKSQQTEAERVAWEAAVAKYPLYQEGEVVTLDFTVGRSPSIKTYHGEYHAVGLTKIQIGSTILYKKDLPEKLLARFDAKLNETLRAKEVKRLLRAGIPFKAREAEKPLDISPTTVGADGVSATAHEECVTACEAADKAYSKAQELQAERLACETIANANRKRNEGREAYLAGDFQQSMELYQAAYRLYQQALDDGMEKLEKDWKDALASEQWMIAREIAAWMTKFNMSRGQQMLQTTKHTESDVYYALGEEALAHKDWSKVSKFADLLRILDDSRMEDLMIRARGGEIEELPNQVKQAMANNDWSQARKGVQRLLELDYDYGDAMLTEINEMESDWLYHNGEDAMYDGNWRMARNNAQRLKDIEGTTARCQEMLSEAVQMGIDELTFLADVAQGQEDWAELEKVANELSDLNIAVAQPFLTELHQHKGGIEIKINVAGMKSARVILYVGNSSYLDSLFKNWCNRSTSLAVAMNNVASAKRREVSNYWRGHHHYWYRDPRPLVRKKYEAKRNAVTAHDELGRAATAFSNALGKANAVYSFDLFKNNIYLPNVDNGDYFLLVRAAVGEKTLIWGKKLIVEYDQTNQVILDKLGQKFIIEN
ncbi:MAG: hypothetical protein IKO40_04680 [Kiritimatiellae bacterium]|nr:hypothetical protein [Kiritimatiellia bacterium]